MTNSAHGFYFTRHSVWMILCFNLLYTNFSYGDDLSAVTKIANTNETINYNGDSKLLSTVIDWKTALDLAQQSDSSLLSQAQTENLRIQRWQNIASMLPAFSVSGNALFYNTNINKQVGTAFGSPSVIKTGQVQMTQPLLSLFPLYANLLATQEQVKQALLSQSGTKQAITQNLAKIWVGIWQSYHTWLVAKQAVIIAQKSQTKTKLFVQNGKATSVDLDKSTATIYGLQTQAKAAFAAFQSNFIALLGILNNDATPDKVSLVFADTLLPDIQPAQPQKQASETSMISAENTQNNPQDTEDIIDNQPAVQSARIGIQIAHTAETAAQLNMWVPQINGLAVFSHNFNPPPAFNVSFAPTGIVFQPIDKSDVANNLYYGLNLNWTVFDWGQDYTRYLQATQLSVQNKVALHNAQTMARQSLLQAQSSVDTNLLQVQVAKSNYAQALQELKKTEILYKSKQLSGLDLLNTQQTANAQKTNLDIAQSNLLLSYFVQNTILNPAQ
jgi:outer membrane protein TolC